MHASARRVLTAFIILFTAAAVAPLLRADATSGARTRFDHSVVAVASGGTGPIPRQGRVVRTALTAAETAAPIQFEVALKMRNFAELQSRIAQGEIIPASEMAAKYFPLASDESRVVAWLKSQGLAVTRTDADHLAVFAEGTVAHVAAALQVTFARVAAPDGEFTSAITSPSVPADLSPVLAGLHGLQPHLRHHRMAAKPLANGSVSAPYTISEIAAAYNANGLGLTGAGQTIAIFGEAFPAQSDVTTFWSAQGIANSWSNIQEVKVQAGPTDPSSDSTVEASLDVEAASSLAPGAVIRIYGANENDGASWDEEFQQVIADLPSQPNLHVFSISFGMNEDETPTDYFTIQSQYIATLAGAGVTVFAAAGDGGSNPSLSTGAYSASSPLTVDSPADDPNATGVGGTTLSLSTSGSTVSVTSETAWFSESGGGGNGSGTGGGISTAFSRPAWQTGTGVPPGSQRLVPDVSADANPDSGIDVYVDGAPSLVGGTSLATPIWAAFCALVDQYRAGHSLGPLGALNSKIYPLNGSSSFRDITVGTNGAYSAGTGYDMCTGIGVPNLQYLIDSQVGTSPIPTTISPVVAIQLANVVTVAGQPATLDVSASGGTTLSYQWQRQAAGTVGFSNLSDNGTYSGSASAMLVVSAAASAMNGDEFQCVVSDSAGSTTSAPVTLVVNSYGSSTLAGWPASGGHVDGAGWNARFDSPNGVVVDSAGNLYVADDANDVIRKITPAGAVSVYAGTFGQTGATNGPVASALFNAPAYLAIDSSNNLYVADSGNYDIREISAAGQVTTVAGLPGIEGTVNGAAATARFFDPEAVAVDSAGNLYVADGEGNTIRKISGGAVTTLAGSGITGSANGTGSAASFNYPTAIAVDAAGNVFVGDSYNDTVREITPAGVVTTLAGSPGRTGSVDGTGSAARFNLTAGLRVDAFDNVYVCDQDNGTIRRITPAGVVTTLSGSAGVIDNIDGLPASARYNEPADLTLTGANGVFYLVDVFNDDVRRIDLGAPQVTRPPASVTVTPGQSAGFSVSATAPTPVSYQWQTQAAGASTWTNLTDAGAVSGSATSTLTISSAALTQNGAEFRCVLTDAAVTVASSPALLSVQGSPEVASASPSGEVVAGSNATLSVTVANSTGVTYQWSFDGNPISGATGSTYTVSNFQAANAGTYSVAITNALGTTTQTFTLGIAARLVNLSAFGAVNEGGVGVLTAGLSISGSGTKQVLLRGIGPSLAGFDIANPLPSPELTLYDSTGAIIDADTGWGNALVAGSSADGVSMSPATSALFKSVGAFALVADTADCAMSGALPSGTYTEAVSGMNGSSGTALVEIYDADTGTPATRLANISALAEVTSSTPLIGGFSVQGSGSEEILVRAVGPTLGAAPYSLANTLSAPVLTVYDSTDAVIASDIGWSNAPVAGSSAVAATVQAATSGIFSQVGAFSLVSGSADCAMVLTLPPGEYTAQVTGANGVTGTALVEIYEVLQ